MSTRLQQLTELLRILVVVQSSRVLRNESRPGAFPTSTLLNGRGSAGKPRSTFRERGWLYLKGALGLTAPRKTAFFELELPCLTLKKSLHAESSFNLPFHIQNCHPPKPLHLGREREQTLPCRLSKSQRSSPSRTDYSSMERFVCVISFSDPPWAATSILIVSKVCRLVRWRQVRPDLPDHKREVRRR